MTAHVVINLLQARSVLLFAPLAKGVLNRLKERLQSRRGPPILQPYFDLWKLFHKDEVVSDKSSWIFRAARYVVFTAPLVITLLIPVLTSYPLLKWAAALCRGPSTTTCNSRRHSDECRTRKGQER